MEYLRIRNWENFQQYKDRDPKWIKLHRTLLEDYDFCKLSDVIIFDNVIIGKSCKLDWCIIDEYVILPNNFHAKDCFITKNSKKGLKIININNNSFSQNYK